MSALPWRDRLVEFFTLSRAEEELRTMPEDFRSWLAREFSISFQKREAAETLWPRGSGAEALRLARAGLDTALSAVGSASTRLPGAPEWLQRARVLLQGARERIGPGRLPALEGHVQAAEENTFRVMIDALLELEDVIGHSLEGAERLGQIRRGRWIATGISSVLAICFLAWLFHVPKFSAAISSADAEPPYAANMAIDGDLNTGWYLPDRQTGWIELTLSKPQTIGVLRVANGFPPRGDRGTKGARVETFLNGKLVKTLDVTLPEPPKNDVVWTDLPLGSGRCDRLRLTVMSYYRNGAGVEEIEVK